MNKCDVSAAVTLALVECAGLRGRLPLTEEIFRQQLQDAGLVPHGADCLFCYQQDARDALLREPHETAIRALTAGDATLFAGFEGAASGEDIDGAFVEPDHWMMLGASVRSAILSGNRGRRSVLITGCGPAAFGMNHTVSVLSASVQKSSGFSTLDMATLDTLKLTQPLPAIPADRPDIVELTIFVEFYARR